MTGPWQITAEEEYSRCPELKESDVKEIQEWISQQPHLPSMSENYVIIYLRACKFDVEKTKQTIDLNLTLRTKCPYFFKDRRLDKMATTLKYASMVVMPEKDLRGNVVLFCSVKKIPLEHWNYDEFIKLSVMIQDVIMWEWGSARGYTFITDMKNVTAAQMYRCPFGHVLEANKYSQDATAVAMDVGHVLHGGALFEKLFAFIKPFMKQEVIDAIKVHSDYDLLVRDVGIKAIPKDYGGEGPTLEEGTEKIIELLYKYQDELVEEENYRVDESKRPVGNSFGSRVMNRLQWWK